MDGWPPPGGGRVSLRVRERTLDELVPFPGNPRVHPAEQLEALAASIRRFGFVVPVVVDGSGTILAGHARVEAARLAGLSRVPTVEAADLTEGQRAAFVASDNKVALMAGWDPALLDALLRDLAREGFDLAAVWTGRLDTHFGYVESVDGSAALEVYPDYPGTRTYAHALHEGMVFSVPGAARVFGSASRGIVVSREDWKGFTVLSGPIEREGRLKYIDGCTDSLLIPPVKMGDPCLNLLYFPPGIDQTRHTHPSDRIGMVLSGKGRCHHWDGAVLEFPEPGGFGPSMAFPRVVHDGPEATTELVPGMIFCIHTNGLHKFTTPHGEELRVLAYHPESDFGPTDEDHPMINRTIVESGVSAATVAAIRTK